MSQLQSATFSEYILLPRRTGPAHALSSISLETRLTETFALGIPFMSAAMESVTGHELAIALSLQGGLAVLPAGRVEAPEQVRQIRLVKDFVPGRLTDCPSVPPSMTLAQIEELERTTGRDCFPVVDDVGVFLGAISSCDYNPQNHLALTVGERMRPLGELLVLGTEQTASQLADTLFDSRYPYVYQVDNAGRLSGVVCRHALRASLSHRCPTMDSRGRLRVAAAISTHPEDRERAQQCVEAGADLLSIDASDGFSDYMQETLAAVSKLQVPVVAGNVVCRSGFEFLADCGADAVKVGIGSGSICTTRRVKAIGRGQATAVREVALARDDWFKRTGKYIPMISDGGLSGTGDMSVALALGADVLMMGKYFAGFLESPTEPYSKQMAVLASGGNGTVSVTVKPYWGEASARAKNVRRYQQNDPRTFVIEGEEGYVLCKGSLHDNLPRDLKALQGTLSSCGVSNLEEFRRDVILERQTVGSQQEGGTSILQG